MAEIRGYSMGNAHYRTKLLALGLTRGVQIKVVGVALLGDPFELAVRGYHLSLRRDEIDILSSATIKKAEGLKVSPRWVAIKALEGDPLICRKLNGTIFVGYLTLLGWSVATIYHALMVSGSSLWFSIGTSILVAMFGGFWAYGRKHRVDMI